jgi:hypothetical protein
MLRKMLWRRKLILLSGWLYTMKYSIICFLSIWIASFASNTYATSNYLELDIPIIDGGVNVKIEELSKFSTINKSYQLSIISIDSILLFYDKYFQSMGWQDQLEKLMPQTKKLAPNWSAKRVAYNKEGNPQATFANRWISDSNLAIGTLELTLTDYNDKRFAGIIKIILSPNIDMTPIIKINKLISENPEYLFILNDQLDENIFKLEKVNIPSMTENISDPIIAEYFKLVRLYKDSFSKYRMKYIEQ